MKKNIIGGNVQRRKKKVDEPETRGILSSSTSGNEGNSRIRSVLRIIYTNADGLVGNGKELEFKDQGDRNRSYFIVKFETKLNKTVKSHVGFLEGYTVTRTEKGGGLGLLVRETTTFQEATVNSGLFSQYILEKMTFDRICLILD